MSIVESSAAAGGLFSETFGNPDSGPLAVGDTRKGLDQRRLLMAGQLAVDILAVGVAMFVAFRLKTVLPGRDPSAAESRHLLLGVLALPVWAAAFWRFHLYSEPHVAGRLDEFRCVVNATLAAVGLTTVMAFLLKLYVARGWLVLSGLLAVVLLTGERKAVRELVVRLRAKGTLLRPVLIVGGNVEALNLCSMLAGSCWLGYEPIGFACDDIEIGACLLEDRPVLGRLADAVELACQAGATGLVVATTAIDHELSNALTRRATQAGLHVELSSSLCDISVSRLMVRPLGRFPVVHVEGVSHDGWESRAKRLFDLGVAATVGALSSPLFLLAALAVKATSRGDVFFRQERVGKAGMPFHVLKFRTMVRDAQERSNEVEHTNEADAPLFKCRRDPRCTRVGRVLRALSIDELPQLWNVLRGEMSLVGPRPALSTEVKRWTPELHQRLAVKPGITGMWQVSGKARWSSFEEYVRLDLYYVDNWSLWTDLAILAKTVPTVLLRRGTH